jgi:two-component system, chemotaxis family, sensor kinase CheA
MIAEPAVRPVGVLDLIKPVKTLFVTEKGKELHEYFEGNIEAEGVVVLDAAVPVGIIMRSDFYQKMGQQFGYNLYYNRPLDILMKKDILLVKLGIELSALGMLSMNRLTQNLYDFIVMLDGDRYIGAISIRDLLVELSKAKEREIELLKYQQDILKEAHEKELQYRRHVEQMNGTLSERNASIKNLLDNADQGFLQFFADNVISDEYSQVCNRIFGCEIGGQSFLAVMTPYADAEMLQTMEQAIKGAFAAGRQVVKDAYLSLLPEEFVIQGRTIRFQYKPLATGEGSRVLVIMTDITAQKKLDAKLAEEKNTIRLVMRAMTHSAEVRHAISSFQDFTAGLQGHMQEWSGDPASLQRLYRQLHTAKGDLAQLGMLHAASALHQVESSLSACMGEDTSAEAIAACLDPLYSRNILEEDIGIITGALGAQFFQEKESLSISLDRLNAIESAVLGAINSSDSKEAIRQFKRIRYGSLRQEIAKYDDYLSFIAQSLSKAVSPIQFEGEEPYVDSTRYSGFCKSLVHVLRNSIDHGLELPQERELLGKPQAGAITCSMMGEGGWLTLAIADDGRGLDAALLKRKAIEKGILTQADADQLGDQEAFALILADGFSTKEQTSELSGRGVGMAAVLQATEELGGRLEIRSKQGSGTTLLFKLPFDEEA